MDTRIRSFYRLTVTALESSGDRCCVAVSRRALRAEMERPAGTAEAPAGSIGNVTGSEEPRMSAPDRSGS
jgi:hypothetical protein